MPADGETTSLRLTGARFRLASGAEVGPLDAEASARRIALIGDWSAWFRCLEGDAALIAGSAELDAAPLASALRGTRVALAPCDPALPLHWTFQRYLQESAALGGRSQRLAREATEAALARFSLGPSAGRTLGALSSVERRLLSLVHATLGAPRVLCCEAPLRRLNLPAAERIEAALELAAADAALIVSVDAVPALGPARSLVDRADVLLLRDATQARRLEPHELELSERLHALVSAQADAFERELLARGVSARRLGRVEAAFAYLPATEHGDCVRFALALPDGASIELVLEAARRANAPLLELVPG